MLTAEEEGGLSLYTAAAFPSASKSTSEAQDKYAFNMVLAENGFLELLLFSKSSKL